MEKKRPFFDIKIPSLPSSGDIENDNFLIIEQKTGTKKVKANKLGSYIENYLVESGFSLTGPTGPQGPQGKPGDSITIVGRVNNVEELPMEGNKSNDGYLIFNKETGYNELWIWILKDESYQWENVGDLKGIEGPTGPKGEQGPQGEVGPTGPAGEIQDITISELKDVNIENLSNRSVLVYDTTNNKWNCDNIELEELENILVETEPENNSSLVYNSELKKWIPKKIESSESTDPLGEAIISEDILVTIDLGNYKAGDVIAKNTTITKALKKLFTVSIPPEYIKPTVQLVSNITGNIEMGKTITPNITVNFNKNDAGNIVSIKLYKDNTEITAKKAAPLVYISPNIIMKNNITFKGEITYEKGPIKNDNLNNPYPTGRIEEGTISMSLSLIAARPMFAYKKTDNLIPTVEEIRATTPVDLNPSKNSEYNIVSSAKDKKCVFAYPAILGDCKQIEFIELNDAHNENAWTKTIMKIPDLTGGNEIDYMVYYYCAPLEFGNQITFKLTI